MRISTALSRAGVSSVLEPGDHGYADAVAGFDLTVPFAPDVVIDARSPADVSSAIAVVAERGETLTVLGSGHGRLHGVRGGVAITLRHLDFVDVDVAGHAAGSVPDRRGSGPDRDCVARSRRGVRIGAGCRCRRLPPRGWNRSSCELLGVQQRPRAFVRHRDAGGRIHHGVRTRPPRPVLGTPRGEGWIRRRRVLDDRPPGVDPRPRWRGVLRGPGRAEVLGAYADWAPSLPGSSTASIALLRLPSRDALPEAIRGRHVVHVRFASLGPGAAARAQLDDIRGVARPLLDTVGDLPYAQLGAIHGDPRDPMPVVNGTASLATLNADTVDAVLGAADLEADRPLSSVEIRTMGPATRPGLAEADAVGGRSTAHLFNVYGAPIPTLTDADRIAAVRGVLGAVRPWRAPVHLVNFIGRANDADAVVRAWTAQQNDRLDSIRARHDPDGLFPYARHGVSTPGSTT